MESSSHYIEAKAFFLRDEEVIVSDSFINYVKTPNEHVSYNQTLALKFDSFCKMKSHLACKKIKKKINNLNLNLNNFMLVKNYINKEIIKKKSKYDKKDNKEKILNLMKMYNKIKETNCVTINSDINNDSEEKMDTEEVLEINSNSSGFFSTFTDGYEKCIDFDKIFIEDFMDLSFLNNLKESTISCCNCENIIGKIIKSSECLIFCKISKEDLEKIENLKTISIFLHLNAVKEIICENFKIIDDILILKTNLIDEILNIRYENIKIKFLEIYGFKIDKSAIKYINGNPGVYVKENNLLKFKYLNIIYEGTDYFICENLKNTLNDLKVNDLIVIDGRNLYDNKRI